MNCGNLQKDWNDGKALAVLVKSLGRQVDKNGTDKVDPMTTTKKGQRVVIISRGTTVHQTIDTSL